MSVPLVGAPARVLRLRRRQACTEFRRRSTRRRFPASPALSAQRLRGACRPCRDACVRVAAGPRTRSSARSFRDRCTVSRAGLRHRCGAVGASRGTSSAAAPHARPPTAGWAGRAGMPAVAGRSVPRSLLARVQTGLHGPVDESVVVHRSSTIAPRSVDGSTVGPGQLVDNPVVRDAERRHSRSCPEGPVRITR